MRSTSQFGLILAKILDSAHFGFSGGKTSPNGWQTFRGKDGSKIDINWNTGRVVRTAAPKYGQNGSTINKGQRLDSSGSEIPRNLPHELHPTETINFK